MCLCREPGFVPRCASLVSSRPARLRFPTRDPGHETCDRPSATAGISSPHMPRLTFLGASGTVTGSRYLLETGPKTVLVDGGLFQGGSELQAKNREPFPVDIAR